MIGYGTDYPDPLTEDGAVLLDDLRAAVTNHVILPNAHATEAVVLWIAATHCLAAFDHATRLVIKSPEKRCGKSRLLEIVTDTCRNPLVTVNCTVPALFRSIGDDPPTLLLDEADSVFGTKVKADLNEDLRGLLNAGFRRGLTTLRTVGPSHTPTPFPTFAMAALAGIGTMPDTIEDRAVIVTMRRRAPGEDVQPYRFRRDRPRLIALRDRLAAWAETVLDRLQGAEPDMPLEDRAADTWEPLIAVADAAGRTWPAKARSAALAMTAAADAADADRSFGARLLDDIRTVLDGRPFIGSHDLVIALRKIEESPWTEDDLSVRKLAQRLKDFGVHPTFDPSKTMRGYKAAHLTDPFARYLTSRNVQASESQQSRENPPDACETPDASKRPEHREASSPIPRNNGPADTWTLTDASPPQASCLDDEEAPADSTAVAACGHPMISINTANGRCAHCILAAISAERASA